MGKAIILDVDGVIIGEKKGINTPHPSEAVMAKLRVVRKSGVPIVLCTAKPAFGIEWEIVNAKLDNPHIADGGALLVDNKGEVAKQSSINGDLASEIVKYMIENNIYVEVYTPDDYYIDKKQKGDWTDKHNLVLQRMPKEVDDLAEFAKENLVTKVMIIVADESEKPIGDRHFAGFSEKADMIWAVHPPVLPLQFGFITAKGISKRQAVFDISDILNVEPNYMLAVGDSTSDWKFMSECGWVGAMGNASAELKELVRERGDKGIIGESVDEDGVIGIIDWYLK